MRAQAVGRKQRIGEVGGIVVNPEFILDPPPGFHPSNDRVAIRLWESRVRGDVVQGVAVGKQAPTLGSAGMFACQRELLGVDHPFIVRTGISAPAGLSVGDELS